MEIQGVTLTKQGKTATIMVDIPASRNALSVPVVEYIDSLVDEVEKDKDIHCLVITGGGEKSFIAGADIGLLVKMSPDEARYSIVAGHKLFSHIEALPIPTIAAVNGYCLGGGLELAMACDIRVCSANAKFGLPEINVGMVPGWGGTLRLPRLIGESRAKNMILRGKMLTSQEAVDCGLVAERWEDIPTMRQEAQKLAEELAEKAPITMMLDKRMIYDGWGKQATDIAQRDSLALGYVFTTHDSIEALTAFLEKRKPEYHGN